MGEILNLIESVSEGFPYYFFLKFQYVVTVIMIIQSGFLHFLLVLLKFQYVVTVIMMIQW